MKKRGFIIAFQGLDRSGKSTQTQMLYRYFKAQQKQSQIIRFPYLNTQIGKLIKQHLQQNNYEPDMRVIHLLFSTNRWQKCQQIIKLAENGVNIIFDRYAYSGCAYSMAKGLDKNWCLLADTGLPKPDVVIYLDAKSQIISKRDNFGKQKYQKIQFQSIIYKKYKELFQIIDTQNLIKIDSEKKNIEQVHKEVINAIENICLKPISKLW